MQEDSDLESFEVPLIASALDFKLWQRVVNIKNEGALDYASKHKFIQLIKDSVKSLALTTQNMYSMNNIVKEGSQPGTRDSTKTWLWLSLK